jgi:hypothetical protein
MKPIPLLVELCAGTAALSLRLHEEGARPPVSRMGAKTGYADIILERMGLVPGQTADAYLWCEPDPGVRLLLLAYTDQTLARAAADVIRGWAEEHPRALWERLKAEGPVKAPEPREVARWVVSGAWSVTGTGAFFRGPHGISSGTHSRSALTIDGMTGRLDALPELPARLMPDASEVDPRELARWARILTSNRLVNPDPVTWTNTGDGGYRFGGEFADPVERLAEGWDLPELPAKVSPGAEAVDPREVARWVTLDSGNRLAPLFWSEKHKEYRTSGRYPGDERAVCFTDLWSTPSAEIVARLDDLPELPATVLAEAVEPPRLPEGSWVYIDPPYQGTTGYAHDLPREEVVRLARLWREAGAHVCISEAEPIPDLVAEGWHVVEITGDRKGQKRTFSKQKREFLTMSREPRGQLGFWGLS